MGAEEGFGTYILKTLNPTTINFVIDNLPCGKADRNLAGAAREALAARKRRIDLIKADTARMRRCICDEYMRGNILGKRNFGEVREYTRKADGAVVAVKTVNSACGERSREHEILKVLSLECFETPGKHQFLEGDLERYLRENGPCQGNTLNTFLEGLSAAVKYCHASQIIHRDIKRENVLVKNGEVRLGDLGKNPMEWL
ncbi:hypothetical protein WA026_014111 [Henosepilachna vigintioctopunctata]|uniref:Protein kinase domain-containing protein n=1 Tax=Henosepilachna vigintioctopunctata TaxID=420089 RepID=A0AAW1TSJ4_9CUCU